MRIPTNSTFTKEMSKKLQRIINPQTTLEELQNLQEEMKMINPVDTHLLNQVSQLKGNGHEQSNKKSVQDARAIRSDRTKEKRICLIKLFKIKQHKKGISFSDFII